MNVALGKIFLTAGLVSIFGFSSAAQTIIAGAEGSPVCKYPNAAKVLLFQAGLQDGGINARFTLTVSYSCVLSSAGEVRQQVYSEVVDNYVDDYNKVRGAKLAEGQFFTDITLDNENIISLKLHSPDGHIEEKMFNESQYAPENEFNNGGLGGG